MKTIRNILLICSIFSVLPRTARGVDVQFSSGNLSVNWVAGDQTTPGFILKLANNPGGIFTNINIGGEYFVEDTDVLAPYGLVYASYNPDVSISDTYLRSGSTVKFELYSQCNRIFEHQRVCQRCSGRHQQLSWYQLSGYQFNPTLRLAPV